MRPKVAFIFSQFPCYDEVFILRQMAELNRLLDLTILSLKRSDRDPVRHRISRPLLDKTIYSKFYFSKKILVSNLELLLHSPIKYLRVLIDIIVLNRRSTEFLFKTLALYPQAIFFASLCKKNKIEHVHGQWATYPAITAMIIARVNEIPFSFTGHAHDIHVKTAGLKAKLAAAKFVLTCTADNKRHLLHLAPGIDPAKIHVIYHGIDLSAYQLKTQSAKRIAHSDKEGKEEREKDERAGEIRIPQSAFRILSVGSLFECKGFEYLIQACKLLREEGFSFRCRIIGGGYLEGKLRRMVSDLELSHRIEITGYQPQEIMPRHYRWADLFILPAVLKIHWGIPNVLLEALAVGVPVACTPLPSLPELIEDPLCGFVFPEKNPGAIADLVRRASRNLDGLKKYGREGRRKIEEKWDIAQTSKSIAKLFFRERKN